MSRILLKKQVSCLLLFSLLLSGCEAMKSTQESDKSDETTYTKEDLSGFLLDVSNAYCDLKAIDFIFWQKYDAPEYQKLYIPQGSNDVPLMRALGNDGLNYLSINNIEADFDKITNSSFKAPFKESIRLTNLGFDFLKKYLTTNSTLKSFEQFRDEAAPSLAGFRTTVPRIEAQLTTDYDNFIKIYPDLVSEGDEVMLLVDNTCTTLMPEIVQNDLRGLPYSKDSQSLTKIDLTLWESAEILEESQPAFIKISRQNTYPRASNNAINVNGTTSNNCDSIEVEAINKDAGVYDKYILNNYKKGHTSFKYGIREDWNNLGAGTNEYTFTASCEGEQIVQDQLVIVMPVLQPIFNNTSFYDSSSNVIETQIDGEFTGWDGETIFKMMDGSIWQQVSYDYTYHYAYMPEVLIYKKGGDYYMKVEDVDDVIRVTRLK